MQLFSVEPCHQGTRLDHFLARVLTEHSRSRLQDLIKTGAILLNQKPTKSSAKLRAGETISFEEPAAEKTEMLAEEIAFEVLYEDDELIVLNKPAGLVVHPAAGNLNHTLVNALLHHCPNLSGIGGEQRPGIVHRLDKETSGCMVVAKNDFAHNALSRQFAGRTIQKIYLALAEGQFKTQAGSITAPLGRHPVDRKKMAVVENARGREASTDYRVLTSFIGGNRVLGGAALPHNNFSLVECTLHTGRTHQIRVHLKSIGHPILGDKVYGKPHGFDRHMLHAWKLGFVHPRTGEEMRFRSSIPDDFVKAVGGWEGATQSLSLL